LDLIPQLSQALPLQHSNTFCAFLFSSRPFIVIVRARKETGPGAAYREFALQGNQWVGSGLCGTRELALCSNQWVGSGLWVQHKGTCFTKQPVGGQ